VDYLFFGFNLRIRFSAFSVSLSGSWLPIKPALPKSTSIRSVPAEINDALV
jgi:hypothetical protein